MSFSFNLNKGEEEITEVLNYHSNELKVSAAAQKIAEANNFLIKTYGFEAIKEDLRKPRIVRIGAVQTSIVAPTTAPVSVQRDKIFEKIGKIIEAAAADNVNILCLQELWSKFDNKTFLFMNKNFLISYLRFYFHTSCTDLCSQLCPMFSARVRFVRVRLKKFRE